MYIYVYVYVCFLKVSGVATITLNQLQYSCQENEGMIRIAVSLQPQQAVDCIVAYRVVSYTACKLAVYIIYYIAAIMYYHTVN